MIAVALRQAAIIGSLLDPSSGQMYWVAELIPAIERHGPVPYGATIAGCAHAAIIADPVAFVRQVDRLAWLLRPTLTRNYDRLLHRCRQSHGRTPDQHTEIRGIAVEVASRRRHITVNKHLRYWSRQPNSQQRPLVIRS